MNYFREIIKDYRNAVPLPPRGHALGTLCAVCAVIAPWGAASAWAQSEGDLGEPALREELPAGSGALVFRNGDRINGRLMSISDQGRRIHWLMSNDEIPWQIERNKVRRIELNQTGSAADTSNDQVTGIAHLTNGNQIVGVVSELSGQVVTMESSGGSLFPLKLEMLRSISLIPGNYLILDGPGKIEDWEGATRGWEIDGAVMTTSNHSVISRRIGDADMIHMRFIMSTTTTTYNLTVKAFCSPSDDRGREGYYELRIGQGWMDLNKADKAKDENGNNRRSVRTVSLGRINETPSIAGIDALEVDLYFDRRNGEVAVYLDGQRAGAWSDKGGGLNSFGEGISLAVSGRSTTSITNLLVTRWNGIYPEDLQRLGSDAPEVLLINGDRMTGDITGIDKSTIAIDTADFGEIRINNRRASQLMLDRDSDGNVARKMPLDVTAVFPDGASVRFEIRDLSGELFSVFSENFGLATLPLHQVRAMRFHHIGEDEMGADSQSNRDGDQSPDDIFDSGW